MTSLSAELDEYLEWLTIEKGRSRATIEAYRRDLTALIAWARDQGHAITEVSEEELERHYNEARLSRSPSTVARAVASARGFFAYLVDEGYALSDPTARLKGGRRGRTLPKPLGEAEIVQLLDSLPAASPFDLRDRALLELLYGTGARVSEVVNLDLSDLDFEEELILLTGKGNKQRLVPIGASLNRALREYLGPGGRPSQLPSKRTTKVFLNARSGVLTRQGIDLVIHKRALMVGIDRHRISAHVFRHSCATHMLAHGADIRVVQELLGHASIATTQLYTAVSVTTLQREYQHAHPRAHD
ncbi:MAG: Tyrosine recombinase XerC [Acidimicrobiaceae bacterium]|nr:Tyrosine recombinase XerC [Acidimicrobiaceae bacterium]